MRSPREIPFSPELMAKLYADREPPANRPDVVEAIEALPGDQRATIELRYYGQLSFEEIAAELGVSIRTAFRWHRRALRRLRGEVSP